jgi:hypothetical protein
MSFAIIERERDTFTIRDKCLIFIINVMMLEEDNCEKIMKVSASFF